MTRSIPRRGSAAALALCVALSLGACAKNGDDPPADGGPADIDTTNASALDGLSNQQIEGSAEAMTPEQAQQLGIVDSSIHVENLGSADTVAPRPGTRDNLPPPPVQRADSAGRDTVK